MMMTGTDGMLLTGPEKPALPLGWRWARLGEVATYLNGRAFKPEDWGTTGLPIIRIQNLNTPDAPFNYYDGHVDPRHLVDDGDLLISWSASLDAFVWKGGPAVLNQHIFKVVENPAIISRDYLYFAAREVMDEIRSQVHGATMQHITKPEFEAIQIPLPPLLEQRRIAALLTERMAAVERARRATEAQLETAKELPAAYLRDIFESEEAQGWPRKRLGEICEFIRGVSFDKAEATTIARPEHLPILRAGNIGDSLDLLHDLIWVPAENVSSEQRLRPGDIAICMSSGSSTVVGKSAPLHQEWNGSVGAFCGIIRAGNANTASYLAYWLRSPSFLAWRDAQARGANIQNLRFSQLANLLCPIPPAAEQQRISTLLAERMAEVKRVRVALETQLGMIDKLSAALLRQAFNGDL